MLTDDEQQMSAENCPWLEVGGATLLPNSAQELWQIIGSISFGMEAGTKFVWRGMADANYPVQSSLHRDFTLMEIEPTEEVIRSHERKLIEKARDWGLAGSEFGHSTDLHILAMLQHHGVHTRLIDATYNPMTALWFACADKPEQPGVLVSMVVTDPEVYETSTRLQATVGSLGDPYGWDYNHALEESAQNGEVFLVVPRYRDARMTAQEGLFITSAIPHEESHPALLGLPRPPHNALFGLMATFMSGGISAKQDTAWGPFAAAGIVIMPSVKNEVLRVLETSFNRSRQTMYPDLPGFVQEYRDKINVDDTWHTIRPQGMKDSK